MKSYRWVEFIQKDIWEGNQEEDIHKCSVDLFLKFYHLFCLSEYLHPSLGDEDRVLKLGGPAVVRADCCPLVLQHQDVGAALTHPGLYSEGHPWQHPAWVRVPEMGDHESLRAFQITINICTCRGKYQEGRGSMILCRAP